MYPQRRQTRHRADRFAQSTPKNVMPVVFSSASRSSNSTWPQWWQAPGGFESPAVELAVAVAPPYPGSRAGDRGLMIARRCLDELQYTSAIPTTATLITMRSPITEL